MGDIGKLFEEVNNNYFQTENKPVTRVYADLEYLQDLRFGALMYGVTIPEEMKYINSCIKRYNNRYNLKTAKYFGALKKSEEDITKLLNTPIDRDRICFLAPWTSVYYQLSSVLLALQKHNHQILEQDQKIKLFINVSDVVYPIELQKYLIQSLEQQLGIEVEIIQQERYTADVQEYLSYEMLFLYDYGKFINTFPAAFVGEGKFSDTRIIAMPYIEEGLGHKPEDYEHILDSTERGLDVYCDFVFLRSQILTDKTEKSEVVNG